MVYLFAVADVLWEVGFVGVSIAGILECKGTVFKRKLENPILVNKEDFYL